MLYLILFTCVDLFVEFVMMIVRQQPHINQQHGDQQLHSRIIIINIIIDIYGENLKTVDEEDDIKERIKCI